MPREPVPRQPDASHLRVFAGISPLAEQTGQLTNQHPNPKSSAHASKSQARLLILLHTAVAPLGTWLLVNLVHPLIGSFNRTNAKIRFQIFSRHRGVCEPLSSTTRINHVSIATTGTKSIQQQSRQRKGNPLTTRKLDTTTKRD
ncbi:hypothetical protein Q7P37_000916 [Cladosporium fusiforme]